MPAGSAEMQAWKIKSVEEKYGSMNGGKSGPFEKRKFIKKIVVDVEGYGDVQTIEEALQLATEGTVIKLCEGVHFCKSTIRTGGIKIEPYSKDKPAYILGDEGPTIKIDVKMDNPQDEEEASRKQVILKRLVLTHNGEAIVKHFKEMCLPSMKIYNKPKMRVISDMKIDPNMNTVLLVESGGVLLRNCLFTLRSLPKNLTRQVPALVALPDTHVSMINCEFVGNSGNLTTACVFLNAATVIISICTF